MEGRRALFVEVVEDRLALGLVVVEDKLELDDRNVVKVSQWVQV